MVEIWVGRDRYRALIAHFQYMSKSQVLLVLEDLLSMRVVLEKLEAEGLRWHLGIEL
jgi:hypothetical protein